MLGRNPRRWELYSVAVAAALAIAVMMSGCGQNGSVISDGVTVPSDLPDACAVTDVAVSATLQNGQTVAVWPLNTNPTLEAWPLNAKGNILGASCTYPFTWRWEANGIRNELVGDLSSKRVMVIAQEAGYLYGQACVRTGVSSEVCGPFTFKVVG